MGQGVVGSRGGGGLDEAGIRQDGRRVEAGDIGDWDDRCLVGGWVEWSEGALVGKVGSKISE